MKNRKIEDIMDELKSVAVVASRDINILPFATRSAHQNAIRSAVEQLVDLRKEYDEKLFSNAYAVVVTGDEVKVEDFKAATDSIGGLTFNFDDFYEILASAVEPSIGFQREFGINQAFIMMQKLENLLVNNGLEFSVKDPNITKSRVVPTRQDLVNYVREILTNAYGNTLTYLYVRANLLARAISVGHVKKALAVTFTGGSSDDLAAAAPLFKNMAQVDVTDAEVDQAYAINTFNKLNKKKPKKAESHNETEENEKENENE